MVWETYLHGFQYLTCDRGGRFNIIRSVFFSFIILVASGFLVQQTYSSVTAYLRFDVATAISFTHLVYGSKQTALDFPAITFCSNNAFLADAVGFNDMSVHGGSAMIAVGEAKNKPVNYKALDFSNLSSANPETLAQFLVEAGQAQQVCKANTSAPPDVLVNVGGLPWLQQISFAYAAQQVTPTSVNSVISCKWQGKFINCSDLFLNRWTDTSTCFTFYPSHFLVEASNIMTHALSEELSSSTFQHNVTNCLWGQNSNYTWSGCDGVYKTSAAAQSTTAFGTSSEQIKRYNLTTWSGGGPQSGLQLFMNVLPTQYCAQKDDTQNTFGFVAFVHARETPPFISATANGIEIAPGFSINVAISTTMIDRTDTRAIGKCGSVDLKWYPGMTYSKDACINQCFSLLVDGVCGCIPFSSPPALIVDKGTFFAICGAPGTTYAQQMCLSNITTGVYYGAYNSTFIPPVCTQSKYMSAGCLLQMCPNCPDECIEYRYDTDVTVAPLRSPATYAKMSGQPVTITDMTQFSKTYLVANFFYNTLDIKVITEQQAMEIKDVINNVGGALGLCLGGSFLVFGEIFFIGLGLLNRCFKEKHEGEEVKPEDQTSRE